MEVVIFGLDFWWSRGVCIGFARFFCFCLKRRFWGVDGWLAGWAVFGGWAPGCLVFIGRVATGPPTRKGDGWSMESTGQGERTHKHLSVG